MTCGKWWCLFACAEVNAKLNWIDAEIEGEAVMLKYKTHSIWHNRIFTVDVEKETETSVWTKGGRRAKRSNYENYFNTWSEAHMHLM